jgi:galactosamine-6-phosphate isomerase
MVVEHCKKMSEQATDRFFEIHIDVAENCESMSAMASEQIAQVVSAKSDAVLCLAAGRTPTRAYELLGQRYRRGEFSTDRLRIVKLDEWCGLPMNDQGTCEVYLQRHVIAPLDIRVGHYVGFRSDPDDPQTEVARVQKAIDALAPFRLTVLGLGKNGHVGFNEPNAELTEHVHVAKLEETTSQHPMVQHSAPLRYGMTLGMNDILRSEEILMVVSGAEKADQLRRLVRGEVTPIFPVSFLHKHPRVRVIADSDAVGTL